jgi:hypothetical protein
MNLVSMQKRLEKLEAAKGLTRVRVIAGPFGGDFDKAVDDAVRSGWARRTDLFSTSIATLMIGNRLRPLNASSAAVSRPFPVHSCRRRAGLLRGGGFFSPFSARYRFRQRIPCGAMKGRLVISVIVELAQGDPAGAQ